MDSCLLKSFLAREKPTYDEIKALPKVLLHEHLDGGLRPSTIIDIAKEINYPHLPTHDPVELEKWFYEQCNSGSLVKYLHCFEHTIAMMQRPQDLVRIARECVLDLAADGVIYAEIRYAPELFVNSEMSYELIIDSVTQGFKEGMDMVSSDNALDFVSDGLDPTSATYLYPIRVESLLCTMRQHSNETGDRIAEYVVKYRDRGVVGFDIAGPENGFPPHRHLTAFNTLRKENLHFTIHAGEDFGLPSIWQAIQVCGSDRLGHGVRLIDDVYHDIDGVQVPVKMNQLDLNTLAQEASKFKLGRLAHYIRDKRITLEICPTSNLQTGCVPSSRLEEHPIHLLHLLRFRITVNTDNRLMSATTMTREFHLLVETFGWTFANIQRATINAMKSAFISFDDRVHLIKRIIKPAYRQMITVKHERDHLGMRRRMSEETETDEEDDHISAAVNVDDF
eukprot:gene8766-9668_t